MRRSRDGVHASTLILACCVSTIMGIVLSTIVIPHEYIPRNYQRPMWAFFEAGGKRGVSVWHRRAGKDLFAINLIAAMSTRRKGLYWHLLPTYKQGRQIVWNGYTKEGRPFLDHFPKGLIKSMNGTEMTVKLKTGSTYQVVGTDDADKLVGTNPIGVVFSEYSLQDPKAWDIIRPILAENEGWALFIYTARGRNHGYDMREMARRNPKWFYSELIAGSGIGATKRPDGTPVISDDVIEDERLAGMPEELIKQEFYCSFDAPVVGAYYGNQMMRMLEESRITRVPWEPKLPVHTAWDLGMGDSTAIWFIQLYGMEYRIIDYYENSGEGLAHYAKHLDKKDYVYGRHYAPHDIEVREMGTGKARIDVAKSLGIRFRVVKQHDPEDGIEAVRNFLPAVWMDCDKCQRGIEALRQYRKEYDEKNKSWSTKPVHDWTSHGADALRTFVMGFKQSHQGKKKKHQQTAESEYSIMSI